MPRNVDYYKSGKPMHMAQSNTKLEEANMTRATLTATIWQEDNAYVSFCPELGVASCGDSPDDAMAMLKEAIELYLENEKLLSSPQALQAMNS